MLRSSSTPVLGSLLSSSYENSDDGYYHHYGANSPARLSPATIHQTYGKLSFHQTRSLALTKVSCKSSPIPPSILYYSDSIQHSYEGIQRAHSEGNLEGLMYSSCNNSDEFYNSKKKQKFLGIPKCSMLDAIPSFSFCNSKARCEEEDDDEGGDENEEEESEESNYGGGEEKFKALASHELSCRQKHITMVERQRHNALASEAERGQFCSELHLARGIGVTASGFTSGGGGGNFNSGDSGRGNEDDSSSDMGEHYRRMVEENPGNPLFHRNYAQYLYQFKQDLWGAEEQFSRAILADPGDGEILAQYAKVVWELYRDQDKALSYFTRAVQVAPEDSYVCAAYACFLWETEEEEVENGTALKDIRSTVPFIQGQTITSASA